MAPRPGEILLFASPVFLSRDNLDLLMAIMCQRHEEAADNTSRKLPKTELKQRKHRLSQMLFSSSILIVFRRMSTLNVPEICAKSKERQHSFGGQVERGKAAFRLRQRERIEGRTLQETKKTESKRDLRIITLRMSWFFRKLQK